MSQAKQYSDVAIERILRLPFGSWKKPEGEDAELDAVRGIIRNFPWMLHVADEGYDEELSQQYLILEMFKVWEENPLNPERIRFIHCLKPPVSSETQVEPAKA